MNMKALIGAAAVALSAISGNALAYDGKSYNGSFCHPYYGNQAGQFRHISAGIQNRSTTSMRWVTCPAVVDDTDNFFRGTYDPWVYWSGSGSMLCIFLSINADGSARQSQLASAGPGQIIIPGVRGHDNPGSYVIACRLPPGAILNVYSVAER